jgi:hypothetical protein
LPAFAGNDEADFIDDELQWTNWFETIPSASAARAYRLEEEGNDGDKIVVTIERQPQPPRQSRAA